MSGTKVGGISIPSLTGGSGNVSTGPTGSTSTTKSGLSTGATGSGVASTTSAVNAATATAPTSPSNTVLVPLKLNAFALTPATCATTNNYSIAPITQPNYTFLRFHDNLIVPDVLDHVDLHQVAPANLNSRLTDLGSGQVHQNRIGVYIHWTLPPVYRAGSAAAPTSSGSTDPTQANRKLSQGYPSASAAAPSFGASTDYTVPDFRPVPNRW